MGKVTETISNQLKIAIRKIKKRGKMDKRDFRACNKMIIVNMEMIKFHVIAIHRKNVLLRTYHWAICMRVTQTCKPVRRF